MAIKAATFKLYVPEDEETPTDGDITCLLNRRPAGDISSLLNGTAGLGEFPRTYCTVPIQRVSLQLPMNSENTHGPDVEGNQCSDDEDDDTEEDSEVSDDDDDDNDETNRPTRERVYNKRKNRLQLKIGMTAPRRDSLMVYRQSLLSPSSASPDGTDVFVEDSAAVKMFETAEGATSPTRSILKRSHSANSKGASRAVLYTILSGIYAMIVVVLGAVLPISEVFADVKHPILGEIFSSYLFLMSIIFLCYTYMYLLRTNKWKVPQLSIRRRLNSSSSSQKPDTGGSIEKKYRRNKVSIHEVDNHHTGSFYLRLGAIAFGIGSMIQSGLHFGMFFNSDKSIMFAISPVLHLMFTFIQLYFIFQNSKMCINRFKTLARFGLMHMVAANMCVWFSNIIEETIREIEQHGHGMGSSHGDNRDDQHALTTQAPPHTTHNQSDDHAYVINSDGYLIYNYTLDNHFQDTKETPGADLMMGVVETAAPYLYPCSIEYSLISAGVLYVMWRHIGKSVVRRRHHNTDADEETRQRAQRMSVDCSQSSRGLFLGILVFVATIISMVVFFVLISSDEYKKTAVLVEHLSEIVLYVLSTVAILFAFKEMHPLGFSARELDLEETLIMVSLTGEYIYSLFSIIAAWFNQEPFGNALTIVSCVFGIIQSTLQTIFLLNGLRRTAYKPEHERLKPGREFVMFLLMCNIAMWGISTFEVQRADANPVQIHYYGPLAWNILVHISVPLSIFFRFHSTVCISNIWKTAWKKKL